MKSSKHASPKTVNMIFFWFMLLLLLGCNQSDEIKEIDGANSSREYIFYILVFLDIAFLGFVLLTRYLTRNDKHEDEENEDDS